MKTQKELESLIKEHNESYRKGEPEISDSDYDELVKLLKENFPDSELLESGVIKIEVSRKQKLPIPMYSLNKVKSLDEFKKWVKSKKLPEDTLFVITPKLDGISLVVHEEQGACWTRGDGEFGQRSDNWFMNIQGAGVNKIDVITFGEAIISKNNFKKYKDEFANPRNMVAGLFNHKTPPNELQYVDYIRYGSNSTLLNKTFELDKCNEINLIEIPYKEVNLFQLNDNLLDEFYKLWGQEYQIDGLVIDVNNYNLRQQLGREENNNPAYAVAYKSPEWSSSAIVKVTGVTWQVSKQGKLKPVIQIEPTEVAGVVISNVTGYNARYVFDNNIVEDSIIKIIRSGDVIPKHIETISHNENLLWDLQDELTVCPCCGEPTKWDETLTELICVNQNCKDKQIAKLVHFFNTVGIEEFGELSIIKFYKEGFNTIQSILLMSKQYMESIEGWGHKSANKLFNQFIQLKEVGLPLAKLLHALDLGEGKIGEKTYQLIFDRSNVENYLTDGKYKVEDLIKIDGIANITAKEFINNLDEFSFNFLILPIAISYIQTPKQEVRGDKFSAQKVCFTGFRDKEIEQKIIEQGGEIVSGVSKNTTILVTKELDSTSSKAVKAISLGVKVFSKEQLLNELGL